MNNDIIGVEGMAQLDTATVECFIKNNATTYLPYFEIEIMKKKFQDVIDYFEKGQLLEPLQRNSLNAYSPFSNSPERILNGFKILKENLFRIKPITANEIAATLCND